MAVLVQPRISGVLMRLSAMNKKPLSL